MLLFRGLSRVVRVNQVVGGSLSGVHTCRRFLTSPTAVFSNDSAINVDKIGNSDDGSSNPGTGSSSSGSTSRAEATAGGEEEVNVVGRFYQDLVYRGSNGKALSLTDLRKILQLCLQYNKVRHGLLAVELYQKKGQDFSEDVNGLFVKMCVQAGSPIVAINHFKKFKNRLSAWSTQTSLHRLVEACKDMKGQDFELLIEAVETISVKGIKMKVESASILLNICISEKSSALYERTVAFLPRFFNDEVIQKLLQDHPKPEAVPSAEEQASSSTTENVAKETTTSSH